jgi:N-acyl-D-aspartate/D-glutamate deacylase
LTPGSPDDFQSRTQSDRFEEGTRPTLIRNATIWTGLDEGNEVIQGDILIDKGLVKKVGSVDESILRSYADVAVLDAAGSWVSPGYADTAPNHSTTYSSKHLVLSTCIPTLEWAVHRH